MKCAILDETWQKGLGCFPSFALDALICAYLIASPIFLFRHLLYYFICVLCHFLYKILWSLVIVCFPRNVCLSSLIDVSCFDIKDCSLKWNWFFNLIIRGKIRLFIENCTLRRRSSFWWCSFIHSARSEIEFKTAHLEKQNTQVEGRWLFSSYKQLKQHNHATMLTHWGPSLVATPTHLFVSIPFRHILLCYLTISNIGWVASSIFHT